MTTTPDQLYPSGAEERLQASSGGGPFTSDLSVNEFALIHEAGFAPLGFVMGSSIYHVGIQIGRWGQSMELDTLTQAMYSARELAMGRMLAEAEVLGADGVIGVKLRMLMYAWGQEVMEFLAVGTAVRSVENPGTYRTEKGRPFTSDLSGQDFFTLLTTGHFPVAFVLGTCVYHVAHQSALKSLRQMGSNVEMDQFTQAVYDARELALSRMQAEAAQDSATGVVGVSVEVMNHVWGEHATEFLATGTAIRKLDEDRQLSSPTLTLPLSG